MSDLGATAHDPQFLRTQRERLEADKERLQAEIDAMVENGLREGWRDSLSELSAYDNHPADAGSETFERGKDIALVDNERILLAGIDRALTALNEGTYGVCQECGRPIGRERLEALPAATVCAECKETMEESRSPEINTRPIEEEVVKFPFGTRLVTDYNAFDGEDSWQAVATYGTSNTPQDVPDAIEYDDSYFNADEDRGIVDSADAIIDPGPGETDFPDIIYELSDDNPRRHPHSTEMRNVRPRT